MKFLDDTFIHSSSRNHFTQLFSQRVISVGIFCPLPCEMTTRAGLVNIRLTAKPAVKWQT